MRAVLDDYTTAPISDRDRALFALIAKIVADSTRIGHADLDAARAAGWSDEALYDAITVCSLFQFYNTWIDATGVSDMPAIGYDLSGKRLATHGYVYADDAGGNGSRSGDAPTKDAVPAARREPVAGD